MITVANINGVPESSHDKGFGCHSDNSNFYFFESREEASAFYASLKSGWDKNSHCAEIEAAVDLLVRNQLNDLWYASMGDLSATALNTKARWNEEAISVNEWQSKCYELFEDYKLSVAEQTALSTEDFINSLPKFNH